jgi:hypothetical protein
LIISAALFGCPNHSETCGPAAGSGGPLDVTATNVALAYGGLMSGQNNDCPGTPGVVSVTITGAETGSAGFGIVTFCVPRPDLLASTPQPLGSGVQVVDLTGADASCSYAFDATVAPTGTVSSSGLCDNGGGSAGFTLVFDGGVTLDRTCGSAKDTVAVMLSGSVDVSPMQQ